MRPDLITAEVLTPDMNQFPQPSGARDAGICPDPGGGDAQHRHEEQPDNSSARLQSGLATDCILRISKWAYVLVQGRIVIFDPHGENAGPVVAELEDVVRLKLGADGHPYALTRQGLVVQIPSGETSGLLAKSKRVLQLPVNAGIDVKDFSVSSRGSVAYLKNSHKGQFAFISASEIPRFQMPDLGMPSPASVAGETAEWVAVESLNGEDMDAVMFDRQGYLHVRSSRGLLYKAHRTTPDGEAVISKRRQNNSILTWKFEPVDRTVPPRSPEEAWLRDGGVQTPADGSLGFFDQFEQPRDRLGPIEMFGVSFFGFQPRSDLKRDKNSLARGALRPRTLGHRLIELGKRYRRKNAEIISGFRAISRASKDAKRLVQELVAEDVKNAEELISKQGIPCIYSGAPEPVSRLTVGFVRPPWLEEIDRRAVDIAQKLEREWLRHSKELQSKLAPGTDQLANAFRRLYEWRLQFLGEEAAVQDPSTRILKSLLDQGASVAVGPRPNSALRKYAEYLRQIQKLHEVLQRATVYTESGFSSKALHDWVLSVLDNANSPGNTPQQTQTIKRVLSVEALSQPLLLIINQASGGLLQRLLPGLARSADLEKVFQPGNLIFQLRQQRLTALGRELAKRDGLTARLESLLAQGAYLQEGISNQYAALAAELSGHNGILGLAIKAGRAGIPSGEILSWVRSTIQKKLPKEQRVRQAPSEIPAWAQPTCEQLLPGANRSSESAIIAIEDSLGLRMADGQEVEHYQSDPRYRRATASPDLVWSPANALFVIWRARNELLGNRAVVDEVTQRLGKLLDKNSYIPRPGAIRFDRETINERSLWGILPRRIARRTEVAVSLLFADTARLVRTAKDAAKDAQAATRDLSSVVMLMENSSGALLHRANFPDRRRFTEFVKVVNTFNEALKDPMSQLVCVAEAKGLHLDLLDLIRNFDGALKEPISQLVDAAKRKDEQFDTREFSVSLNKALEEPIAKLVEAAELRGIRIDASGLSREFDRVQQYPNSQLARLANGKKARISYRKLIKRFKKVLHEPLSQYVRGTEATEELSTSLPQHYIERVRQLTPGGEISLGISAGKGVDFDGIAFVKALAGIQIIKSLLAPLGLDTFNLQPMPNGSWTGDYLITIQKKENGIAVSFKYARGNNFGFGSKQTAGKALSGKIGNWSFFWFLPVGESPPSLDVQIQAETIVSLDVSDNDLGSVYNFLENFLSGRYTAKEILKEASGVSVSRGVLTTPKLTLPYQLFTALGAIYSLARGWQLKGILAPFLLQTSFGVAFTGGKSETRGSDGVHQQRVSRWALGLQENLLSIFEAQAANAALLSDSTWQDQNKVPLFIPGRRWYLWLKQKKNQGYTCHYDGGELVRIAAEVRTSRAPRYDWAHTPRVLTDGAQHFNKRNIPQLAKLEEARPDLREHLLKITQSTEPVVTTMELIPEALAVVNAYRSGMPIDLSHLEYLRTDKRFVALVNRLGKRPFSEKGRNALIRGLIRNPDTQRIVDIAVIKENKHEKALSGGLVMLRLQMGATTAYRYTYAAIKMTYQSDGRVDCDLSGDLLVPRVAPNLRAFAEAASTMRKEHVAYLGDPIPLGWEWMAALKSNTDRLAEDTIVMSVPWDIVRRKNSLQGHLVLDNGALAYRTRNGKTIDLPKEYEDLLISNYRENLLLYMMRGENKILNDSAHVLGEKHYRHLEDLAANPQTPQAWNFPPVLDPHCSLFITDILEQLQYTLAPLSNPGQKAILERLFPQPNGQSGVDTQRLLRLVGTSGQQAERSCYLHSIKTYQDDFICGNLRRERIAKVLGGIEPGERRGPKVLLDEMDWSATGTEFQIGLHHGVPIFRAAHGAIQKDLPPSIVNSLIERFPALLLDMIVGATGPMRDQQNLLTESDRVELRWIAKTNRRESVVHSPVFAHTEPLYSLKTVMTEIAKGNRFVLKNPGWDYFFRQFFHKADGTLNLDRLQAVAKDPSKRHAFLTCIDRRRDRAALDIQDPELRFLLGLRGTVEEIQKGLPGMISPLLPRFDQRPKTAAQKSLRALRFGSREYRYLAKEGAGLLNGWPVYYMPDGTYRPLSPSEVHSLVQACGTPLLLEMSQQKSGYLREPSGLNAEDTRRLLQRAFVPMGKEKLYPAVSRRENRTFDVIDILHDLRSGRITVLDPVDEYILGRFGVDRAAVKELLSDPGCLRLFETEVLNYEASLGLGAGQTHGAWMDRVYGWASKSAFQFSERIKPQTRGDPEKAGGDPDWQYTIVPSASDSIHLREQQSLPRDSNLTTSRRSAPRGIV